MPKPYTCQICGKTDETVCMWCGGPWGYAHHKCIELAGKIIDHYFKTMQTTHYGMAAIARRILENCPNAHYTIEVRSLSELTNKTDKEVSE